MGAAKKNIKSYLYDVALSFAGEDRVLAKQIAETLRANGVRVFYDEFYRAELWGKELYEYIQEIYGKRSKYVIIFVSEAYLNKEWTNHERKSALNAAFRRKEDLILPIRLDDTELPGLHQSIGYLDAKRLLPIDICNDFLAKIGNKNSILLQTSVLLYRLTHRRYAIDISGTGASLSNGRWHKLGINILYSSTSLPMAILEIIPYKSLLNIRDFVVVQYSIPSNVLVDTVYDSDLPQNWRAFPANAETQEFGTEWVEKNENCILSVPSAVLPSERTFLLNPKNDRYKLLEIKEVGPLPLDKRFYTGKI